MRIVRISHAIFAATFIAFGICGLIAADFTPIWQPVPTDIPARAVLAYLCTFVSLACGIGLLWRRTAAAAARWLLAYLLLWMLVFKAPGIFHAPLVEVSYESCGETAVIVAGAWVLYASLATAWDKRRLDFACGDRGQRAANFLFGLALVAFGLSHFAYAKQTAALVPAWLPWHFAWAYFFGCTYLAAGAAMLVGVYARLAAALSVVQMGLFTLLVWAPFLMTGPSADQWSEFVVSWSLTASAWVVADSFRAKSALSLGRR